MLSDGSRKRKDPTETISTPWLARFLAEALEVSRVMPRITHSSRILGSLRMALTTEPPWSPVLPMTVMSFLEDDIVLVDSLGSEAGGGMETSKPGEDVALRVH